MRVIDEKTLDRYRGPGECEICHKMCKRREPHHLRAKGMSSGSRLDVDVNLISLGSSLSFECECHTKIHAGHISKQHILEIVARREGRMVESIVDEVNLLLRTQHRK
jgi:hypothetical protein